MTKPIGPIARIASTDGVASVEDVLPLAMYAPDACIEAKAR